MLICLFSKNTKKIRKIKIYKKKKLRDQFWKPSNIFAYKYWSSTHTKKGAILKHKKNTKKENPNPNPSLSKERRLPPFPLIFSKPPLPPLEKKTSTTYTSRPSLAPAPAFPSLLPPPPAFLPRLSSLFNYNRLTISSHSPLPSAKQTRNQPLKPPSPLSISLSKTASQHHPSPLSADPSASLSGSTNRPNHSSNRSPSTSNRVVPRLLRPTVSLTGQQQSFLPPAAPADPTASSGGPNTAAPTDQQPSFLLLPATRNGGEEEKPTEEPICSEADLKEKREGQIRKPWKKIKTVCLLRFFGYFAGHRRREGEEERKQWPTLLLAWVFLRRRVNPRAASGGGTWGDAPPLFLRLQKAFPAISGVLGAIL